MIRSLYNSVEDVIKSFFPCLLVATIILSILRIIYILKSKRKFILYREILFLIFEVYIVCLFEVVTIGDINTLSGNNFVPFVEILRYKPFGRLFIKNIVGNVVMFVPLGVFLGRYTKGKKPLFLIFLVTLASISIECTQLLIGRVFDVDDIILNVSGGIIGYILYLLFKVIYIVLPNKLKEEKVKNLLAIILLIVVIFVMINMLL